MEIETFDKISLLKNYIADVVRTSHAAELPISILFHEAVNANKYKITIEVIEQEYFIDSKGIKWKRVKEDPSNV